MNSVFIVFGYGIPKNILIDDNYNFYLKMVFNKIYGFVVENKIGNPTIITCGGATDMIKPYKRTEADEMIKFFRYFIQQRPFVKQITKNWQFIAEKKSLSTLENLLNSNQIIQKGIITNPNLYVFCERTREKRIKVLVKKIFGNKIKVSVVSIDFDVSKNRYLSTEFIEQKENVELKYSLWALKSSENLKKHHQLFVKKIEHLRSVGPSSHQKELRLWWEEQIKELSK